MLQCWRHFGEEISASNPFLVGHLFLSPRHIFFTFPLITLHLARYCIYLVPRVPVHSFIHHQANYKSPWVFCSISCVYSLLFMSYYVQILTCDCVKYIHIEYWMASHSNQNFAKGLHAKTPRFMLAANIILSLMTLFSKLVPKIA